MRRNPVSRRRRSRRSGGGGGKLSLSSIKGLFSKDNIKTGVGVIAATSATRLFLRQSFAANLPGLSATTAASTRQAALIAYMALIPGLVGILVRKYDRAISDGLIIGGIANAASQALGSYAPQASATLGLSEYLDAPRMRAMGAPITAPGYGGIRAFGANGGGSALESSAAFKRSNW